MSRRRQHSKGKARSSAWHRGRTAGRINDRAFRAFEREFSRAERDERDVTLRAAAARLEQLDYDRLLEQLDRVAPTAPVLLPDWFGR